MSSARHPLPTDLVALIAHDGRVYPNEAHTWDRMASGGSGPHPLETALEQWLSFATGKHTWVSVRGATIRGLVSARRRAKRSAWEVDCLINADADDSVALSLLERMTVGVGKQGAERAFLRLGAESALTEIARGAGFFVYARQELFRAQAIEATPPPNLPLRRATKSDGFGIYQLYNAATPANVRAIEGATYKEWLAGREPWSGRKSDLVREEDGLITAWIRFQRGNESRFSLLARPEVDVEPLLRAALSRLGGADTLACLVPDHDQRLAARLGDAGFRPSGCFSAMARRLTRPLRERAADTMGTAVTAN
jgi:hypothetical protein